MSILLSALLLQSTATLPSDASGLEASPAPVARTCRDMLVSSSRLGAIKVCKTRAQWQRWERCHGATRYCAPPRHQTVTVASLPGDKLVCKYLKVTGSRIEQQKVCATKRQWELSELETQETVRNRQNMSSLTSEGATGGRNFTPLTTPSVGIDPGLILNGPR
jgi:hypothetical protein